MNIVMVTNTYLPHTDSVARSVEAFSGMYRQRGHRVLIAAPDCKQRTGNEPYVIRLPPLENFYDDISPARTPHFSGLTAILDEFDPQIVHSHHPCLLGMTALRIARSRNLPIVFTHHTLYEQDGRCIPDDSALLRHLLAALTIRYANLMDQVIAPNDSIRGRITASGVTAPVLVIPAGTGEDRSQFGNEDAQTATAHSLTDSTDLLLDIYHRLLLKPFHYRQDESRWQGVPGRFRAEWEILGTLAGAINHSLEHALNDPEPDDRH